MYYAVFKHRARNVKPETVSYVDRNGWFKDAVKTCTCTHKPRARTKFVKYENKQNKRPRMSRDGE